MHCLRRESDMRAYRHIALDEEVHRIGHELTTFELHPLRARGQ